MSTEKKIEAKEKLEFVEIKPYEVELVKDNWKLIVSTKQDEFMEKFYDRFFEQNPTYRPLFKGDMATQRRKLAKMFSRVAQHCHRIKDVVPQLHNLGRRHQGYNVKPEYFANMRNAFTWSLAMVLKDDFTDEMRTAWIKVFNAMNFFMIEGLEGKDETTSAYKPSSDGDADSDAGSADTEPTTDASGTTTTTGAKDGSEKEKKKKLKTEKCIVN